MLQSYSKGIMHFNMVYRRRNTLSSIDMMIVIFLATLGVSRSYNTTWYSSNMTVTRSLVSSDYFDFWYNKGTKECSLSVVPNVCQRYGAVKVKTSCTKPCCVRCMCKKNTPTFIVEKQQCVQDRNITQLSGIDKFEFVTRTNTFCNTSVIPTLDLRSGGNRTFMICMNGVKRTSEEVMSCSLTPGKHYIVDDLDSLVNAYSDVHKNGFKVNKKLEFKWAGLGTTPLQVPIVSLAVHCTIETWMGRRFILIDIKSKLYFKIAGSQTLTGPQVFYFISKRVQPTTIASTTSTKATPTIVTEYRSKLNIVQGLNENDLKLVIVASVLGSLLLLVSCGAFVTIIVMFNRKQKLNISGGKHTSNPTYERGPDQSLLQNGHQVSTLKSNFYQPLVENTRESSRKEPIYESLDDHLRDSKVSLTENPNRCSLAYCDVTDDGYLIPTDGPTPLPCPTDTDPRPPKDNATRPRLSSSYDEPEVILKERKPKIKVDMSSEDEKPKADINSDENLQVDLSSDVKAKPYYHELDENNEEKTHQDGNETVDDNSKSPTENTYLELFGDTRAPLESEIL